MGLMTVTAVEMVCSLLMAVSLITAVFLLRTICMISAIRKRRLVKTPLTSGARRLRPSSLLIVLGSGGHTKEMLALLKTMSGKDFSPRTYVLAVTDKFSEAKVQDLHKSAEDSEFTISKIPRSREVKQTYWSSLFTTLYATLYTLPLVLRANPDAVLCNGPGTCVPICLWTFLSKVILFRNTKLVFIESICRVKTLSLTGKLVYHLCDCFVVQWPELADKFPLSQYIGRLL